MRKINQYACAFIADYQGNIRAVVDSTGTAIQTTDYYPYGLPMATATAPAANRYKYGAKEFETRNGLNFHDFEARMLFNDHTLFGRPDDKAGKYPHLTPYLYCAANPLRYIDPTGEDWYSYLDDETGDIVYKYTVATSQQELNNAGINGTYVGAIVVVIYGSMNEKLGKHDSLKGEGAVLANVTVYGPGGESDIEDYLGFTLTSNYEKFGAIADGEYDVKYVIKGKSGNLSSHYAINGGNAVDCIDGVNRSPQEYNPHSKTQKDGVYIHRSNLNGFAGENLKEHKAISTGCILIYPDHWNSFCKQIGNNDFKMILKRSQ